MNAGVTWFGWYDVAMLGFEGLTFGHSAARRCFVTCQTKQVTKGASAGPPAACRSKLSSPHHTGLDWGWPGWLGKLGRVGAQALPIHCLRSPWSWDETGYQRYFPLLGAERFFSSFLFFFLPRSFSFYKKMRYVDRLSALAMAGQPGALPPTQDTTQPLLRASTNLGAAGCILVTMRPAPSDVCSAYADEEACRQPWYLRFANFTIVGVRISLAEERLPPFSRPSDNSHLPWTRGRSYAGDISLSPEQRSS